MFFLKKFYKNKIEKLNIEMKALERDESRLVQDIHGMRKLIEDPNLANQVTLNVSVYYKLTRNLENNNARQLVVYEKLRKLKSKI